MRQSTNVLWPSLNKVANEMQDNLEDTCIEIIGTLENQRGKHWSKMLLCYAKRSCHENRIHEIDATRWARIKPQQNLLIQNGQSSFYTHTYIM